METRVAVISIIVENTDSAEPLNGILHEYSSYIIGSIVFISGRIKPLCALPEADSHG